MLNNKKATKKEARIAVLLPCFNEEGAIGDVVRSVATVLSDATIYVVDNNSSDRTVQEALEAGAVILTESCQGKGNVVRRMFREIDADIYLMVDGDGSYDVSNAPQLIETLYTNHLDMVVGKRVHTQKKKVYRPGHLLGNQILTVLSRLFFGRGFTDTLSGYRVFSRRFVKSLPVISTGFEIEAEITAHCLSLKLPHAEVNIAYRERAKGTQSKLRTYRDGLRITLLMIHLFKEYRPSLFFGLITTVLATAGALLLLPVFRKYMETGQIMYSLLLVLSGGLLVTASVSTGFGLILGNIARMRIENRRLFYLLQSTQVDYSLPKSLLNSGSSPVSD